jgi:hypothetical protein
MATARKPKNDPHLTITGRPAWHGALVGLIEHVADTSTDADAVRMTVLRAVGIMAEIGNVRGETFVLVRDRAVMYSGAVFADRAIVRALNAAPGSHECKPHALIAAVQDAHRVREETRRLLCSTLLDVRPSLALT